MCHTDNLQIVQGPQICRTKNLQMYIAQIDTVITIQSINYIVYTGIGPNFDIWNEMYISEHTDETILIRWKIIICI